MGMPQCHLGLGLRKIRSSSTQMAKKNTSNLSPSQHNTSSSSKIEISASVDVMWSERYGVSLKVAIGERGYVLGISA